MGVILALLYYRGKEAFFWR